jgi:glutamine cyclotransferase
MQQRRTWRTILATIIVTAFLLSGCGLFGADEPTPAPLPTLTATLIPTQEPAPTPLPPATIPPQPTATTASTTVVPLYTYQIVNILPHDPNAFTQGLVFEDGLFYEGTGLKGRSSLRRVDVKSGQVRQQHDLAPEFFGEGIALWNDRIIQLTWQEKVAFIYDKTTLAELGQFSYATEGWGLTSDGQRLIMSDGSDTLFFRDPETFEEIGRVQVLYQGQPVFKLNELEFINGEVFANIWQTNYIVRIDPTSGQVVGVIDLTGILDNVPLMQPADVLNGIAYDAATDRLFVTGKLWPAIFEIDLVQVQ